MSLQLREMASNPAYVAQPQPGYGYAPQPQQQQQPVYVQQPGQAPVGYGTAGQPQYVMAAAAPVQQPMMMAAQPGMVVAPAGYAVVPLLAPDLISAIGRLSGAFVTQKVNLAEALTDGAWQQQNRYKVSAWDPVAGREQPKAGKGGDLIKMKETSDCCLRLLCGPARPFKMAIYADDPSIGTFRKDGEPLLYPDAMVIERPFRCTFFCLCRPIAKVKHNTLGYIGELYSPFRCCSREFVIRPPTQDDDLKGPVAPSVAQMGQADWYVINGTICQPGFLCFFPCGDCAKVTFEIYAADDHERAKPLGHVARVWPGCLKALATDSDNYVIEYPQAANPIQKAAILSAAPFIDFVLFETSGKRNDNNNASAGGDILGSIIGAALR